MTLDKTQIGFVPSEPRDQTEPRPYLTVILDSGEETLHPLGEAPLTVGRAPDCDIVVASGAVSRRHAEIALDGRDVIVTDLGSTNGTAIGGERLVAPTRLRASQTCRIGPARITVSWHAPGELEGQRELERDLDRASKYVTSLLPRRIAEGPVQVDWAFQPSAKLGGDIFGYHALNQTTGACYMVDVTGHGVGAAMHGTSIFSALRRESLPGTDFRDPAQVLARLNDSFQMDDHDGFCFTIWYGVYDGGTRLLRYASAGHHPAYLMTADRRAIMPLSVRNPIMGVLPGHVFEADQVRLPPDCRLYLFSDGAFEIEDRAHRQCALPDFLPLLTQPEEPGKGEPQRLYDAVNARRLPGPWADDCSIMTVSFR